MFFHPFENDLTQLKDQDVENKLIELNKKYHIAARLGESGLLTQLSTFITIYRDELSRRYAIRAQQNDGDLNQLINVD